MNLSLKRNFFFLDRIPFQTRVYPGQKAILAREKILKRIFFRREIILLMTYPRQESALDTKFVRGREIHSWTVKVFYGQKFTFGLGSILIGEFIRTGSYIRTRFSTPIEAISGKKILNKKKPSCLSLF